MGYLIQFIPLLGPPKRTIKPKLGFMGLRGSSRYDILNQPPATRGLP